MKLRFLSLTILSILATIACSSQKTATYREAPVPKFSNSRDFVEAPEVLFPLATKILSQRVSESDPATETGIKKDGNTVQTGWVYSKSSDKYLEYSFNGVPRRKELGVRRKLAYTIAPTVAGSIVTVSADEEIEDLDKKTGNRKGWKKVDADRAVFQRMLSDLELAVNSR